MKNVADYILILEKVYTEEVHIILILNIESFRLCSSRSVVFGDFWVYYRIFYLKNRKKASIYIPI